MLNVWKRLGRVNEHFYQSTSGNFKKHDFPFQIEKSNWKIVDDLNIADIVPYIMNNRVHADQSVISTGNNQLAVNMLIYEIDHTYSEQFFMEIVESCSKFAKHNVLVHKNRNLKDHSDTRLLYYDSLWDHAKLYFTDFDNIDEPENKIWTEYATKDIYNVPVIEKTGKKKFFSMAYVHSLRHPRNRYRAALSEVLNEYADDGYIGVEGNRILPNNPPKMIIERLKDSNAGFWYPAADQYYKDTYLSIYVETITNSMFDVRCVTEKTFDHLAKGNFILPFGYKGLIQDIVDYGFIMPSWINYYYDNIENDEIRFHSFLYEVDMALSKSKETLHELYLKDKHILEHNQKVFFNRDFDGFYNKLKSRYDMLVNK